MAITPLPDLNDPFWYDWAQAIHDAAAAVVDGRLSAEQLAETIDAAIDEALDQLAQPRADATMKLVIFQNADGTWPARTTVTADPNASVDWIARLGNLTAPTVGGTGMGVDDFHEIRPTS